MGNMFLTAPSLSQHAGLAALDSHAELQKHVAVYAKNRQLLLAALPALGLADIAPPDGAFYIYADVSRFTDNSLKFCEDILRNIHAAGYTEAQGFLIARPMPADQVKKLLDGEDDSMPFAPMAQRAAS